ncbi:Hypothetical protein NGAL_HAMBI1146_07700 [Neorhizobium galegae bv. officinalis]|nr:Hypothetical protein NGAL_HAMBI490_47930 [Neorhizobium galegae bv. officinalis]CDZ34262.1 Hypothetical protein NGAL_HAMBI1146_07700 [Neorhizobium galegae bv. officinalis]
MTCSNVQIDKEAELVALARLVIYAREAAKGLRSIEVEAGLTVTLEAITRELTGVDVGETDHSPKTPGQTYQ